MTNEIASILPFVPFAISIIVLLVTIKISQRNIRLSIKQAIFKTVSEKARDCNDFWESEPESEKNSTSPHFKIMSELIITKEIIDKSVELFGKDSKRIKEFEDDFYYLLWKQLRTDLRDWFSKIKANSFYKTNAIFKEQVEHFWEKVKNHMEQLKTKDATVST